ncbi:MAG: ArsR family transcriptional regulator [Thermoplasmata archaeon]|nr:ArsR family transcriptional regulator [Thermoplasmata archaeon]
MNPAFRSLMWYLLVGTRGGPNRRRILEELRRSPSNAHQLASTLGLDYRTVRHHLRLLEQNSVISRTVPGAYAPPYELSPYLAEHFDLVWDTVVTLAHPRSRRATLPLGAAARNTGGVP